MGGVLYGTDTEGRSGAAGRVWSEIEKDDFCCEEFSMFVLNHGM
jgi:hypothetical protein